MFIVNLTYIKPLEIIDQIRPDHLEFLNEYYEKGIFLVSGAQNPRLGGIIIADKLSRKELESILKKDPLFIKKAAKFEVIEFRASKYNQCLKNFLQENDK